MARSVTGTDFVQATNVSLGNAAKGLSFWSQLSSLVNNARFVQTTGNTQFACFYNTTNNRIVVEFYTSGTVGRWYANGADHGLDLTAQPFFFSAAWDGDITHTPVCYMATQGQSAVSPVALTLNSTPTGTANVDTTVTVTMGNQGGGSTPLTGWLEHVHVFDRVPSQSEFSQGLLASTAGKVGGTAAGRWLLDSSSPATDLSGAGHDATVTGTSVVSGVTLFAGAADSPALFMRRRRFQHMMVR